MTSVLLVGAIVVAAICWAVLFVPERDGIWTRSWIVATVLVAYSTVALLALDDLAEAFGPLGIAEYAIGAAVGGAWLIGTHVGHVVLCRFCPTFLDQTRDLYAIAAGDQRRAIVGPIVAMGVAEEMMFRGLLQPEGGFALGLAVYTVVQLVEKKWALVLAALSGGTVWGLLAWWRDGLVAAIVAHVLWTSILTFVWPLRGLRRYPDPRGGGDRRHVAPGQPVARPSCR